MDVTDVIGPVGRHQKKTLAIISLRSFAAVFVIFTTQFSLMQVDHWCSPPEIFSNLSSENWKECCVPQTAPGVYSKCEHYSVNEDGKVTNQTLSCNKWSFDKNIQYRTMRNDYNLVCDRGWYISALYMSFTIGNFIAYIPGGQIADKYGRKPVTLIGTALATAICIITFFCNSVDFFLVARFLTGVAFGIYQNPNLCLLTEVMGPEYRSWIIIPFSGAFGLAMMIMAGISYFITDWKYIILISSFPIHVPLFILIWKLVPESSRWLLSVKRYEEAEKQITAQAKENGIAIVNMKAVMDELKKKVEMDKEQQGKYNILDLLRNKLLLRITTVLYISFFITVIVYHGFTISVGQLGGSFHLNFFLGGVVEILSVVIFFLFITRVSRRRSLLLSMMIGGISFLLTIPMSEDLNWLRIFFAMFGRLCNTTTFSLLYLFAMEIFPTNLRAVGVSGGMSAGRIGSILASFTDDLGRVYGRSTPLAVYGVLCLLSCATFLLLPETSHKHLPDTVEETKMISRNAIILSRGATVEVTDQPSTPD